MSPYRTPARFHEADVPLDARSLRARRSLHAVAIALACAPAFAPLFASAPRRAPTRVVLYRVTIEPPVLGGKRCLPRGGPCDF